MNIYYGMIRHEGWYFYIGATNKGLCFVGSQDKGFTELENWYKKNRPNTKLIKNEPFVQSYGRQLVEYLNGSRQKMDFPLDLKGTDFQTTVWTELGTIPFGETKSYTDIAIRIGKPKSVRAVGRAVGLNPLLIVIPCHRVLAKNGQLTGYRGGLMMKKKIARIGKMKKSLR